MSGLRRRLHDQDEGISLIEVMVGLSIILIALAAFASTLTQSLQTVTSDEQLVRGNQYAAEIIERDRTYAFDCQGDTACIELEGQLGFYTDDPGYSNVASDGSFTVTLGSTRPTVAGAPVPGPLPAETTPPRDGITYDVTREIVWVDDPTQPGTQDYKELRVKLDWTAAGRSYTTSTSATRFDRPDPIEECTAGEVVGFDISPAFVQISTSGITTQAVTVTVETCTATSFVKLTPTPLSERNMTVDPTSGGRIFRIDDFPAGTTQFSPGEYTWTIQTADLAAASEDITFVQSDENLLAIDEIIPSPLQICVDPARAAYTPTAIAVDVVGADDDDSVVVAWTDADGSVAATSGDALRWNATIPAGTVFNSGSTTVTATAVRSTDTFTVTENLTVTVVQAATAAECPA